MKSGCKLVAIEGVQYLERNGRTLACPYSQDDTGCGNWCPLFDIIVIGNDVQKPAVKLQLHCGSGNAEYEIEAIK